MQINLFHCPFSYLLEDQLAGPSSVDGYVQALKLGARYIEIDVYDGHAPADDPEPIVYHGNTLTTKILFHAVLDVIREHAFEKTDYPLIIAIQNHCSLQQQMKIVQILSGILGDKLYTMSNDAERKSMKQLPSPVQLRGRIILKASNCWKTVRKIYIWRHYLINKLIINQKSLINIV